MCNATCMNFGKAHLTSDDVRGKAVIEVGSMNLNGSLRTVAEALGPSCYIGVDLKEGPGVDIVCDVLDLIDRFGAGTFDVLISTELLEHVRDWRRVINTFKHILKPNGILLLTTRSRGFPFHEYPFDYWRFETSDMQYLFSDFVVEALENDPLRPGVFVKARKPTAFKEIGTAGYRLYSIIKGKRSQDITKADVSWFKVRYALRQSIASIAPLRRILRIGDLI